MKLKSVLTVVLFSCSAAIAQTPGNYELSVMEEETCHEFGQKAVNAYDARKKGVPKTKVLKYYSKTLAKESSDAALLRRVLDFGYNEATSVNEAGMRGWAMCKDVFAEIYRRESDKYR